MGRVWPRIARGETEEIFGEPGHPALTKTTPSSIQTPRLTICRVAGLALTRQCRRLLPIPHHGIGLDCRGPSHGPGPGQCCRTCPTSSLSSRLGLDPALTSLV